MKKRNTILAPITAGLLTFVAFKPSLATGACWISKIFGPRRCLCSASECRYGRKRQPADNEECLR